MAESENRRSDEGRSGADRSGPPARSRSLLVAVLLSIPQISLASRTRRRRREPMARRPLLRHLPDRARGPPQADPSAGRIGGGRDHRIRAAGLACDGLTKAIPDYPSAVIACCAG